MHSFVWIVFIIDLSHHAFGNYLSEVVLSDSNFLSDDEFINDIEAPNLLSTSLTPQDPDYSDFASTQPFDISWLTDPSTSLDTADLFADSSTAPFDNSLFFEVSDDLLQSSCAGTDERNFQPVSKREDDNGVCSTPKTEADSFHLKQPDLLDDFKQSVQSELKKSSTLESFPIPVTPGYTNEDDKDCRLPRRRLCCEGPLGSGETRGFAAHCRGMKGFVLFFFGPIFLDF